MWRSVRHRTGIVLSVLLLALLMAAPARAGIISVVATNDVGEPLDTSITTLQDNETLWAWVASATGGAVCVHPLPIGEDASCAGSALTAPACRRSPCTRRWARCRRRTSSLSPPAAVGSPAKSWR